MLARARTVNVERHARRQRSVMIKMPGEMAARVNENPIENRDMLIIKNTSTSKSARNRRPLKSLDACRA
jgi:hypothetical protein